MLGWRGKPEVREGWREEGCEGGGDWSWEGSWEGAFVCGIEVLGDGWAGDVEMGSGLVALVADGESMNIIEGPDASSGAIAVRGVGLEVNLGSDWCRMVGGRAAPDSGDDEYALSGVPATFALLRADVSITVSEAVASGCGLRGVTVSVVGRVAS